MKTIRQMAGVFILLSGVLHIYLYSKHPNDSGNIGILVFGLAYCITGLLLFNKRQYPLYLGVCVPLVGMTLSLVKFGIPEIFS